MVCCGEEMTELEANTTEAAYEKHLQVVTKNGDKIKVEIGSAQHPMTKEHFIQWIYLESEKGGRKELNPDNKPEATFALVEDKAIAAYEYCNIHGLWKTEIE